MQVQENVSLKPYNTFGVDAIARYFARFRSSAELQKVLFDMRNAPNETFVLGGGSNILLTKDFEGLVLKNEVSRIEKIAEDDDYVYIKCGAGENWHQFVLHCIENNWAGIENLSLIPGCVGASPMQNIGAYGVEIKDVFHELTAFHILEQHSSIFKMQDCEFGYRESVFKGRLKDQFIILDVTFRLNKNPKFNTSYGAVESELEKMGVRELTIRAISQAVINIRSSKLPDPAVIGNAGSFFKNPSVPSQIFENLRARYPGIVGYQNVDSSVKLAAGWLIEQSAPANSKSWKGYRTGDAGVHARQALVLVNYGHASGIDILQLSEQVMQSVFEKFGVMLEREVNII
jgi:UDP-N-acetylmuramate dehydrogenase